MRHKHEFTGLWSHLGEYGRQDVHYHACFDARCRRMLFGPGRNCDGRPETHRDNVGKLPVGGGTNNPGT